MKIKYILERELEKIVLEDDLELPELDVIFDSIAIMQRIAHQVLYEEQYKK